jgi:antitoxin HigA-1
MTRIAIHPGQHLAEQLSEIDMSAAELGRQLKVPTNRITEIINGDRSITGDTALRLGHFFGNTAQFWLNLQVLHELKLAEERTGEDVRQLPTITKLTKKRSQRGQEKLL